VGYLAAFFIAVNGLLLELVGGRMATDHVDVFFMFFVLLAILFAVLFSQSRHYLWNLACAVSVGLAILCKWLPALIVLPVWLSLVLHYGMSWKKVWVQGAVLIIVITVIVVPWQWYIYTKFPLEAAWESHYNVLHLLKDLEHTGKPWYYYADVLRVSYGELIYIPLIWILYMSFKNRFDGRIWALLVWGFIPSIFFSFSATKLQGYTLFSAGALFLITALFIDALLRKELISRLNWLRTGFVVVMLLLPVRYCIERLKPFQSIEDMPQWQENIVRFSHRIEGVDKVVVFNTGHPIEYMFHTDVTAYRRLPNDKVLDSLESIGYSIYIGSEEGLPTPRVP
jgi:4-amino-4-deoxy-L-arabinose transferase